MLHPTISIRQPWAWAILAAGKSVENRGWRTNYRGPLLIHAAKSLASEGSIAECFSICHRIGVSIPEIDTLPRGVIVAQVDLVDCLPVGEITGPDRIWVDPEGWGFILRAPQSVVPVPYRGMPGLFETSLPIEFLKRESPAAIAASL